MIRPASASKPTAQNLREDGVDVLLADLTDGVVKLKSVLYGVDIVISATSAWSLHEQKDVIQAAKETGVKRFVPCDFGTPGARGVRFLHDSVSVVRCSCNPCSEKLRTHAEAGDP